MSNTTINVHGVNSVKILKPLNCNGVDRPYQSQAVCFYDKEGICILQIAAYSQGETFESQEYPRKTLTIGDKTYYEDELAEALKNIKEVK